MKNRLYCFCQSVSVGLEAEGLPDVLPCRFRLHSSKALTCFRFGGSSDLLSSFFGYGSERDSADQNGDKGNKGF
ncbi:MAG: hypothetical protein LBF89_02825 [Bacteroidales bacterium]|nr:hypothetical protein [Bacteroidales bacterium]